MSGANCILKVRDLQARRGGVPILDIHALDIREGEVLSLIGPNGAGKSSLLLALACLLPWYQGTLRFRETPVSRGNGVLAYRRKIAMVFQEPLLLDTTVRENVATGLKLRGLNRSEILKTVPECLERFGIAHLAERHARKLSGGEAQRASLARAFATKPEMIFLDEPFSSLDPPTRDALIEDLQRVLHETGTTTLIATHDRLEALRLSDRVAVIKEGKIVQLNAPETVMNQPTDAFIASFVGMETILAGEITGTGSGTVTVRINGGELEAVGVGKPGERVLCCTRPEQVTLFTKSTIEGTSARNTFAGRIVKIVPLGLFYKVCIDCGFSLVAYVTASSLADLALEEGVSVFASVKATAVHLIRK